MKVKIVINTIELHDDTTVSDRRSEVWSGEMDILPKGEYLTKISIIAEGYPQPICDVPFSPSVGHYMWIPPDTEMVHDLFGTLEGRESKMIGDDQ